MLLIFSFHARFVLTKKAITFISVRSRFFYKLCCRLTKTPRNQFIHYFSLLKSLWPHLKALSSFFLFFSFFLYITKKNTWFSNFLIFTKIILSIYIYLLVFFKNHIDSSISDIFIYLFIYSSLRHTWLFHVCANEVVVDLSETFLKNIYVFVALFIIFFLSFFPSLSVSLFYSFQYPNVFTAPSTTSTDRQHGNDLRYTPIIFFNCSRKPFCIF